MFGPGEASEPEMLDAAQSLIHTLASWHTYIHDAFQWYANCLLQARTAGDLFGLILDPILIDWLVTEKLEFDTSACGHLGGMARPEEERFGRYGRRLYELARGIDHNPVVSNRPTKSISAEDTLEPGCVFVRNGRLNSAAG